MNLPDLPDILGTLAARRLPGGPEYVGNDLLTPAEVALIDLNASIPVAAYESPPLRGMIDVCSRTWTGCCGSDGRKAVEVRVDCADLLEVVRVRMLVAGDGIALTDVSSGGADYRQMRSNASWTLHRTATATISRAARGTYASRTRSCRAACTRQAPWSRATPARPHPNEGADL